MRFTCTIDTPLPTADKPLDPGAGCGFVLEGSAYCREADIAALTVHFDGKAYGVVEFGNARREQAAEIGANDPLGRKRATRSGFWIVLPISAVDEARALPLRVEAKLRGGGVLHSAAQTVHVAPGPRLAHAGKPLIGTLPQNPRVCICMATYNPSEGVFRRQVESIRAQTHTNWVCVVQDDASSFSSLDGIRRVLGDDPRFILRRNEKNVGFYYNFEKLLQRVPADCDLFCLSDQDDRWNADKIASLVAGFETPDTMLVYSDMRIVDDQGAVLCDTYWSLRRNNYRDIEALFFANTVTGAASMVKAALLPRLLPFPQKIGESSFHDWWIALAALASGRIGYVNRPLYDYYQHVNNALGWRSQISKPLMFGELLRSPDYRRKVAHSIMKVYSESGRFHAEVIQTLQLRVPASRHREAIERLMGINRAPLRTLFSQAMRSKWNRRASEVQERNMGIAFLGARLINMYFGWKSRSSLMAPADGGKSLRPQYEGQALAVDEFERRSAPMKLAVRSEEKPRVNMLLPMIDFKHFFGGYIGKFQVARALARAGFNVRFVLVDYCEFEPELWRHEIQKYRGLENIFDLVEVAYQGERREPLDVSPRDRFISTTCWNAWIADAAARELGTGRFIALIQEYEPFVFPHGSLCALSHAAYELNLFAVFSTELLRDFFRINRLGVFRHGALEGNERSISFQNATVPFAIDEARLRRHEGRRRLLFYCRPEEHNQRNMFEMGVLALRKAIRDGHLNPAEWEFQGIGTIGPSFSVPLPGAQLTATRRTDLRQYADYLPDYDLGMSLMYTPHPSLVPLEMAAAGLVTVTNSYANKTAEALRAISTNFEVGEATVEDLSQALRRAALRVGDIAGRVAGSRIHWPTSWEEALAPDVIAPLLKELASLRAGVALRK